jgi:NDP-sugar pyrophosphorylase family protein
MINPLSKIPVLILAGGLGTRLKSVVADKPKALAPIMGKPFLEIQIELLKDQGATHFVLCVGYLSQLISETFGDGSKFGVRIDYSEERDQLRGTAGAIKLAQPFIKDRALVLNGDTYLDFDHNELVARHLAEIKFGAKATCTLARLENASRFGTVILDEHDHYVAGFLEKNANNHGPAWLNAGAYMLERSFVEAIAPDKIISLEREIFPNLIAKGGKIAATLSSSPFYDIGTPEDYKGFSDLYQRWNHDRHRAA